MRVVDEKIVQPGAGTVLIVGNAPNLQPTPAPGVVLIEGNQPVVLIADRIVPVGASVVEINGGKPLIFLPARVVLLLAKARQRATHAAQFSLRYPPPDYDVTIPVMIKPLPGRIVQMTAGEVLVVGNTPSLLVDNAQYVGATAGTVDIIGNAPFAFWSRELPAGASEVLILGALPQAYLSESELAVSAGAGVVEVVGYNPGIGIVIGWSEMGIGSATWSASTTVVGSWSDVVVTTSIWTRQ